MTDLTDDELAAQEGAFDDPAVDVPVLPPRALAMCGVEFLEYEANFLPTGVDGSDYGKSKASYRDDLTAWLDAYYANGDVARFMRRLVDLLGPRADVEVNSAYSMTAIECRKAMKEWLSQHAS
jgi:hypothetical protein